ncbi:hypothetical protein STRCI_001244 [Streptomyces cinnabarinus]|uniref:Uncharacterized protein n=1 Tax=Streptomyces cinnabarinus TaxID=67287 RepID=A0ABY7K6M0_9ACTN|nr:hypothetical protein [Streptomyces cinnabarinus]WAZ20145.1 hypothetical protein STRCI_001244 [Streptomyces cinnabarinus]
MLSQRDKAELAALAVLGVDPVGLDPGPADLLHAPGWQARVWPDAPTRKPCSACGRPATSTRLVPLPGLGPRWIDACRDHMVAGWRARSASITE